MTSQDTTVLRQYECDQHLQKSDTTQLDQKY